MNFKRIQNIFFFVLFFSPWFGLNTSYLQGQINNTLYFVPEIYQARFLNPAYPLSCRTVIGVPILSSMYLDYMNTNISYNKIFNEETPTQPHVLNPQLLINKLSKRNFISFDAHFHLFSLGIKRKSGDFTFDVTEKTRLWTGIPRQLLGFPIYGNGDPNYFQSSFNGLGVDFDYYREFALGYSRRINEYYSIGVRTKLLFGKLNLYTKELDIGINTNEEDFRWTVYSNANINASFPIIIQQDNSGNITGVSLASISPIELFFNRSNPGFAIDLGGILKINENLSAYASIVDLGFIRWRSNVQNINQDGEFTFSGFTNLLNLGETNFSELLDSLYNEFLVDVGHLNYTSFLPLQIYLGSSYQLLPKLTVGALNRNMIYNKKIFPSLTLTLNYQLFKFSKIALGYSIINRSFNNIGLTWYIGSKGLQFYVSQDNNLFLPFNGVIYQQTGLVSSRLLGFQNYNIRFGLNILIGCRAKKINYDKLMCPWMRRMEPEWLKNKEYYPNYLKKPGKNKKKK